MRRALEGPSSGSPRSQTSTTSTALVLCILVLARSIVIPPKNHWGHERGEHHRPYHCSPGELAIEHPVNDERNHEETSNEEDFRLLRQLPRLSWHGPSRVIGCERRGMSPSSADPLTLPLPYSVHSSALMGRRVAAIAWRCAGPPSTSGTPTAASLGLSRCSAFSAAESYRAAASRCRSTGADLSALRVDRNSRPAVMPQASALSPSQKVPAPVGKRSAVTFFLGSPSSEA